MPTVNDELYRQLQTSDVVLAFDTSITSRKGFFSFCEQVSRINTKREALNFPWRVQLCVPAAAHTETLFHLAQKHGDTYDVHTINQRLNHYRVTVPEFTQLDAEHCAELLVQRYQTPAEWRAFKKRRCLECIGLPIEYHHLAEGGGKECGAPNDWLIIAQANCRRMWLVMDDLGRHDEFRLVSNKVNFNEVNNTLQRVLSELIQQFEGENP